MALFGIIKLKHFVSAFKFNSMKSIKKTKLAKSTHEKSKFEGRINTRLNKRIILVVIAIVLLLVAALLILLKQDSKELNEVEPVVVSCAEDPTTETCLALKEAAELIDPSKVKELSTVVEKIKNITGYENDPNLLYVLLTYYLNISDGTNAKKYYDLLVSAYKSEVGYDPILTNVINLDELERIVKFLENSSTEAKKNSYTVPPEPQ